MGWRLRPCRCKPRFWRCCKIVYVTDEMIAAMAVRYGAPEKRTFRFAVTDHEYDRIRRSQRNGRNHDATLYVIKDGKVIVIAKHFYPPGLYRAPSGGLNPGESFDDGINREMAEEIGCVVGLDRFLLQTDVSFDRGGDTIRWRSFVFFAHYVGGTFDFTDKHEISEVRLAEWSEFDGFSRIMRSLDIGGLHYRAALHESVCEVKDSLRL
jgi:ADP-ribose pyrophosphatase YjhB (NUDIX family)